MTSLPTDIAARLGVTLPVADITTVFSVRSAAGGYFEVYWSTTERLFLYRFPEDPFFRRVVAATTDYLKSQFGLGAAPVSAPMRFREHLYNALLAKGLRAYPT